MQLAVAQFKNFGLEEESDDDDPLFGGKDGDEEEATACSHRSHLAGGGVLDCSGISRLLDSFSACLSMPCPCLLANHLASKQFSTIGIMIQCRLLDQSCFAFHTSLT